MTHAIPEPLSLHVDDRMLEWRAHEVALNRFRQFSMLLAGIDLHFIH